MAGGKNDASALGCTNAGCGAAEVRAGARTDLDEHQRSIARAHHQVNLSTATARRSIIALQQAQPLRLQVLQRLGFGSVTHAFGGGCSARGRGF